MAQREHHYRVNIEWSGNSGNRTASYNAYSRDYDIAAGDKQTIAGSSDPAFLADDTHRNSAELLVATASACHKLWYLHRCAEAGLCVYAYRDRARGTMTSEGK